MQGGASDPSVRLRSAIDAAKCCEKPEGKKKKQKITPPFDTLTVGSEILISPEADKYLLRAREWFALALATPIAWLHLDASVEVCRERKHQRVRDGSAVVVEIQRRCRSSVGDFYFSFWSFFAEEEFYLLALPILFWNIDYRFARQLTLVVCFGLLWGNLIKDVFRLPRPWNVEPKVWVPRTASQIDSTACRDFGYPSTHSMNAVSNSLFLVMYSLEYGLAGRPLNPWFLLVGVVVWIFSLCFARLYLGVHSPTDVKGGMLMGLALVFICQRPISLLDRLDRFFLSAPHFGVLLMLLCAALLILNPQPRPMTPTFMQNCVLCGLTWGCTVGFRMETDRRHGRGILGLSTAPENGFSHNGSNDIGLGLLALRTILGYTMVLVMRAVMKCLLTLLLRQVGFDPNPAARVGEKDEQPELQGWDIFAAAFLKTGVYAALAWSITCGCPAAFEVIGLPSEMNG